MENKTSNETELADLALVINKKKNLLLDIKTDETFTKKLNSNEKTIMEFQSMDMRTWQDSNTVNQFFENEKILNNQIKQFSNVYRKVVAELVFYFIKEVCEKKKMHCGSGEFQPSDFAITPNLRLYLRNKIWYYCYFMKYGGDDWFASLFQNDPSLKLKNLYGLRQSYNRANDIMNGVSKIITSFIILFFVKILYIIYI
jgi:hypothetical protein